MVISAFSLRVNGASLCVVDVGHQHQLRPDSDPAGCSRPPVRTVVGFFHCVRHVFYFSTMHPLGQYALVWCYHNLFGVGQQVRGGMNEIKCQFGESLTQTTVFLGCSGVCVGVQGSSNWLSRWLFLDVIYINIYRQKDTRGRNWPHYGFGWMTETLFRSDASERGSEPSG